MGILCSLSRFVSVKELIESIVFQILKFIAVKIVNYTTF